MNTKKGKIASSKIISKAIKIFAEVGFSSTTLQQVADASGVQKPVIVYYFKDKYGLFSACIDEVLNTFSEILSEMVHDSDSAVVRLEKNFLANLVLAKDYSEQMQLMVFLYYTAKHNDDFNEPFLKILTSSRKRYLAILLAGVREGDFNLSFDASLIAELLHEMIVGTLIPFGTEKGKGMEKKLRLKWKMAILQLTGCSAKLLKNI